MRAIVLFLLALIVTSINAQTIKVPSLYLHGENDGCIGANLSEGMENFFDDLESKILPDCGHFLPENPFFAIGPRILSMARL